MFRLIGSLLIVAVAGGGAYLTKPAEAAMKAEADTVFAKVRREQAKDLDLGGLAKGAVDRLTETATYEDFKVAAHYVVKDGEKETLSCWGAATKIMCSVPNVS